MEEFVTSSHQIKSSMPCVRWLCMLHGHCFIWDIKHIWYICIFCVSHRKEEAKLARDRWHDLSYEKKHLILQRFCPLSWTSVSSVIVCTETIQVWLEGKKKTSHTVWTVELGYVPWKILSDFSFRSLNEISLKMMLQML